MEEESPVGLLLLMQGVTKSFPGVRALDDVSFELAEGEVHALVGENGAGKTTLMNVLNGVVTPDQGRILLDGQEVRFSTPADAMACGIAYVHQELNLVDELSIKENLFLGHLPSSAWGKVDWAHMARQAEKALSTVGLKLDPDVLVGDLSVAEKQMLEIARALLSESRILVLDEPTSSLTDEETRRLFKLIKELRTQGKGIIYISHRLEEIFELADRITVLRNGKVVGTRSVQELDTDRVVHMMVGRDLGPVTGRKQSQVGPVVLKVVSASGPGRVKDVSLEVRAGEILGLAGLVGSGRTELLELICGARPMRQGHLEINGWVGRCRSPREALRRGLAYVPEDRVSKGLFLNFGICPNVRVSHMEAHSRLGVAPKCRPEDEQELVKQLKIATPSLEQRVLNLSGGNRQKVVLAKCLRAGARVLLVNEPTRGIDVGARAEVYELLTKLTQQGLAVIVASSDLTELFTLSDRIIALYEGRIVDTFEGPDFQREEILRAMFGHPRSVQRDGGNSHGDR